ncbi:MAG: hypothetical protein A3F76_03235 [Burkholderiales bacterium RIFCSPLOWO2_12_FULL_65_40]|nr:MAG: hypothetical protein A3F76_03235 [Burkholderiales bacterium RIFCSPLOWO2_12_FULL_65_40]
MALVLLIVGLLAAVFLPATNTLLDNNRRKETRAKLEALEQAMVRFVMVNRRLPCPADGALPPGNANQGLELVAAGACSPATQINGVVPWRSLGVAQGDATDAWNTLVTYRVWAQLTTADAMNMNWNPATQNAQIQGFLQARGFRVCSASPCAASAAAELANRTNMTGAAYVLISHGANRVHGFNTDGAYVAVANGAGPGPLEDINRNQLAIRSTAPSDFYIDAELAENPAAYYDDIVLRPTVMAVAMAAGLGPRKP